MLIYGEPGAGKTHFIGTAADHEDTSPVLLLDVDGGVRTLRKKSNVDVKQVRSYAEMTHIYMNLFNAIEDESLPYKTIGFDSLSEFQKLDLSKVNKDYSSENSKIEEDVPDQRSYYKSGNHVTKIVRAFRDLPCNVIFTAHESTDRDNFNRIIRFPQFPGKLKNDIPGFLDVVGHLRVEVHGDTLVRQLQTAKTETLIAKDRNGVFDAIEIDPTIPALWEKLKGDNNAGS